MGFFGKSPEQGKEGESKGFLHTAPGRARTAYENGHAVFQCRENISTRWGFKNALWGSYDFETDNVHESQVGGTVTTVEAVESEGWELVNAGYVHEITGTNSRDKFLASGQEETVNGRIVGIYLFRRNADNRTTNQHD